MSFAQRENNPIENEYDSDRESSNASDNDSEYDENENDDDDEEEIIKVKPASASNKEQDDVDEESDDDNEDDMEEEEDEEELDEEEDDEMDVDDDDEEDKPKRKPAKKSTKRANNKRKFTEDDSDEEEDEHYLQKINDDLKKDIILNYHPELKSHNYDEINKLAQVVRNQDGIIIDPFHKTIPFLTKYELARVLGERAMQINAGGKPYIDLEEGVFDGYTIATLELSQKKIPFIVKRPLPNGGCEYWKLHDLEMVF